MQPSKNPRPNRPEFDPVRHLTSGGTLFMALLAGAVLLGGLLGLFQQQGIEAALAQAPAPASSASGAVVASTTP